MKKLCLILVMWVGTAFAMLDEDHDVDGPSLFHWQIEKHYETLCQQVRSTTNEDLKTWVGQLKSAIEENDVFFSSDHDDLKSSLRSLIVRWLKTDVLTEENYDKERRTPTPSPVPNDEEEQEEEGEDAWRTSFQRGYDGEVGSWSNDDSSDTANERPSFEEMEDDQEEEDEDASHQTDGSDSEGSSLSSNDDSCPKKKPRLSGDGMEDDGEDEEDDEKTWQETKIQEILGLKGLNADTLLKDKVDDGAIIRFLKGHVENGGSWLINQIIEGDYELSDQLIGKFINQLDEKGQPVLRKVLGMLWWYFAWDEENISSPSYLQSVYLSALESVIDGSTNPDDIKERILKELGQEKLLGPDTLGFKEIARRYNKYVEKSQWILAQREWALYTTYRKKAHSELVAQAAIDKAKERASKYYKVYPHESTKTLVYGAKNPAKKASLEMSGVLGILRAVGKSVEPCRLRGPENILVPRLYVIASNKAHQKGGDHQRIFVEVPLPRLGNHRLHVKGTLGESEDDYWTAVDKDCTDGWKLMRVPEGDRDADALEKKDCQRLIHSERVWLTMLRSADFRSSLVEKLKAHFGLLPAAGQKIKVYGVLSLLYSTNSVCKFCTPSLIAAQNSHENGFLGYFAKDLVKTGYFKVRGFNEKTQKVDASKFRMHTVVSAQTNFDSQAHDLASAGEHNHTQVSKPNKDHNPEAKLFFEKDEIDLHPSPQDKDGQVDPKQTFFFEFVGKNLHPGQATLPYTSVVCSSGSNNWDARVSTSILGPSL